MDAEASRLLSHLTAIGRLGHVRTDFVEAQASIQESGAVQPTCHNYQFSPTSLHATFVKNKELLILIALPGGSATNTTLGN